MHGQAPVTLTQTVTVYAGNGSPAFTNDYGPPATAVGLNSPSFLVVDKTGNQYISDTGNNCVRKIDTNGNITTLVGYEANGTNGDTCNVALSATPAVANGLIKPMGLALDSSSNLYIADSGHNCIRRLPSGTTGTVNLVNVAGTCSTVTTTSATPSPSGIVIDSSNNLYIAIQDTESTPALSNYQVLRESVTPANTAAADKLTACVVAGNLSALVPTQCTGITNGITLSKPSGLAVDFAGSVYVADTGNNCVRQVTGTGAPVTTVGLCANDNKGSSATALHSPYGLIFGATQALFISETAPDNVVRYTPNTGTLTINGGLPTGASGAYAPAQNGAVSQTVPLNQPRGLAVDNYNNVYIADSQNSVVRSLSFNYIFNDITYPSTPVGTKSPLVNAVTFLVNTTSNLSATVGPDYTIVNNTCSGAIAASTTSTPTSCQVFVSFTPTKPGQRYSALTIKDSISGQVVSTGLQGMATGSNGLLVPGIVNTIASNLNSPTAVATDSGGNAYILEIGATPGTADVRILPPGGGSSTLAIKVGAGLVTPSGIASDAAGNWYIADATQNTVTEFTTNGTTVPVTIPGGFTAPSAIYVDALGNLYVSQQGTAHNVIEVYASGTYRVIAGSGTVAAADSVAANTALFVSPAGVTLDQNGILYITDTGGHRVYTVDTTNTIHLYAGNGTTTSTGTSALQTGLISPTSIVVDPAGDGYIADSGANKVYSVFAAGSLSTVIGTGTAGNTGDGGVSVAATVNGPLSVALDGTGDVFIVDSGNKSVREITYPNTTTLSFGNVPVGSTSTSAGPQYFANIGTDLLQLVPSTIGITVSSTTPSAFSVNSATTTCGPTLLSGTVCAIGYSFKPTAAQSYFASTVLSSNAYNTPTTINLNGNGQALLSVTTIFPAESEVYGSPFAETATFATTSSTAPTGTVAFSVAGKTLCSFTGTIATNFSCPAANSGLAVGTYTVTVTYSGDSNYSPISTTTLLTVTPAPLTVVVNNQTRAYGTPNPTLTGTFSGGVNGDTILVAYATTATQASAPGTYPITATLTTVGSANLSNYTVTNTPGTLTVTKAALNLTVAVVNVSRQYGTANPAFTDTISGALLGDTFTVTYGTTATITSPVGTYPITLTVGGAAAANYNITATPGTLTVTPAPLTVNVSSGTRPYGTANPTFTATITGALNGDVLTATPSTTATITSPVGSYPVTATVSGANAGNYTVTVNPGTLTITKATATVNVAVNNATRVYGAANPAFTSTVTGALNGDTFTITYATTATATSPVGSYTITPTVSGAAAANYTITTTNGTLTVTAAPLTVAAVSASRTYGAANPTFTDTTTGLVNGDTVTITNSTTATATSAVGSYSIVPAVSGTALSNYTLVTTNGTLTVNAAPLTVTVTPATASRGYGVANPTFTATITGAVNGDVLTATVSTTATATSPVGSYPVTATIAGTNAADYIVTVVPATLNITQSATTTTLTGTPASPVNTGAGVTFTATVTSPGGIPTGTVTFFDGGSSIGTATLGAAGTALLTTTALVTGNHTISATYTATPAFAGSSSAPLAYTILGSFNVTSPTQPQYLRGAGSTPYTINVASVNGFFGPVALSCSGLPADATCSFATQTVNVPAGGTATTVMTVTTTVADAALIAPANLNPKADARTSVQSAAMLPIMLFGLGFLGFSIRNRKRLGLDKMRLLVLIIGTLGIMGMTGCGCPTTTFKTYTINVTGVSTTVVAPSSSTSVVLSVGTSN
ncbi:MBG domain-containing protein [Granulicella rosea]|nr:MBG domain-containing protein [Granulicella rosea]